MKKLSWKQSRIKVDKAFVMSINMDLNFFMMHIKPHTWLLDLDHILKRHQERQFKIHKKFFFIVVFFYNQTTNRKATK